MEAEAREITDKKEQVKSYWTRRSHDFAELRKKELNSPMAELWLAELSENHAHKQMDMGLRRECNVIKSQLEVSCHVRPAWDVQLLERAGFRHIELDLEVSRRVYREINEFYNPTPLFSICAVK